MASAQQYSLPLSNGRRPQVLLLGNGLNRVYGGTSWQGFLQKINRSRFTTEQVKALPFPLQAVLLSEDHVDASLKTMKTFLTQWTKIAWLDEQLKKLLDIPFDCILTSNFTYELECAADPDFPAHPLRYQRHTDWVRRAETGFMLHTYYSLPWKDRQIPLFHVHGEARKPDSMILGHYYYGILLFHFDDYLNRRGVWGKEALSWLDYFLLGDVYSLGFGFDVSEMDLWWLLCRKKKESHPHGEIHMFEPFRQKEETKLALLEAYDVRMHSLDVSEPVAEEYRSFYEKAIPVIGEQVRKKAHLR